MEPSGKRRRRLRAVLAADVANFGGLVSVDETSTLDALWTIRRIAREELDTHGGWLFGLPGDGIFALFESAVDAVRCALHTQTRLATLPKLNTTRLRIGVHLGEVLFQDDLPFGEALVIASRLESLAEPGGILVSETVMDAVAPRISAAFCERGVFSLKHSPRRVATFSVSALPSAGDLDRTSSSAEPLDQTVLSVVLERAGDKATSPPVTRILAEPKITSLPKAAPLVVPGVSDKAISSNQGPAPQATVSSGSGTVNTPLLQACLAELTEVLTMHLGPVARVLVKRHAANFKDPFELIDALAREIPATVEHPGFLIRAREVVARQRR